MSEKLPTTVEEIINDTSLSKSEKDRLVMMVDPKFQFIQYLNSCIVSLTNKNALMTEIEQSLSAELADGTLSTGAKLKIFEILSKKESDSGTAVLNVLSKALETKAGKPTDAPTGSGEATKSGTNVSQEDYKQAKSVMSLIDKISKGEFNKEDFFQKK